MKFLKNKYGFTLVELIVIIAVSAIVLTPFSLLMTASLRNEVAVNKTIDAQHKTQAAFIAINELARGVGFDEIELDLTYLSYGNAIRLGSKVVYLDSANSKLKYRTYLDTSSDTTSEIELSDYVHDITFTLSASALDIILEIDKYDDSDDSNNEIFYYKYSKRE